jgi:hypothetical protein
MDNYINNLNKLFKTNIDCKNASDNLEICAQISKYKNNAKFDQEFIKNLEKHYSKTYGIKNKLNTIDDIKEVENKIYDNILLKQEIKKKNLEDQYQDLKNIQNQFRNYLKYSSDVKMIAAALPTIAPTPTPAPAPAPVPAPAPAPAPVPAPAQPARKYTKPTELPKVQPKFKVQPVNVPQPVKITPPTDKSSQFKFTPIPFVNKRETLEDVLENKGKELADMYGMTQKSSRYIRDGKIDDFHKLDSSELDLTEKALIESVKMFDLNLDKHVKFVSSNMEKYNKMSNVNKSKIKEMQNILMDIEKQGDVVGKLLSSEALKKTCIECMDLFTKDENGTVISDFEKDYNSTTFSDVNKRREYIAKVNKKLHDMINTIQLKYHSTQNTAYINLIKQLENCYEQLFNIQNPVCRAHIKNVMPAKNVVNPY